MRILDENDNEIQEEDVDLEEGYLTPDQIFKEHHDAVPAQARVYHYEVTAVYFEDGTNYKPVGPNDPHITTEDPTSGHFYYVPQQGEELKQVRGMDLREVEDQAAVEAKEAWDEYEDIQRYKLYTEEEKEAKRQEKEAEEKKEELLSTGLDRIEGLESTDETHTEEINAANESIDDLILLMADIVGSEEEE